MITLKMGHLMGGAFVNSMQKVANTQGLPIKTAYNASRIMKAAQKELENGRKLFQKVLDEHTKKGEDGKPVAGEDGMVTINPELQAAYEKQVEELQELELKLPFLPLELAALEKCGLSPNQLIALEPIIHTLEEVPAPGQAAGA